MPACTKDISHQPWERVWPTKFSGQRACNYEVENELYLQYVDSVHPSVLESVDEESDSDSDSDGVEDDELGNGQAEHSIQDEKIGGINNCENIVRKFMSGPNSLHQVPEYGQIECVTEFCNLSSGEIDRTVALLDDRNNDPSVKTIKGKSRPYLGPLTADKLHDELSKQVKLIDIDRLRWANRLYSA